MPLNVKFRNFGKLGVISAIIINMVVIGLWHGANWTYAIFGLVQGLFFIPLILSGSFFKPTKQKKTKYGLPTFLDLGKMIGTFLLVSFSLIIFRANNLDEAFNIFVKIFTNQGGIFLDEPTLFFAFLSLPILLLKDFKDEYHLNVNFIHSKHSIVRYTSIIMLSIYIMFMGVFHGGQFIYFQF